MSHEPAAWRGALEVARAVRLIAAVTPSNAEAELERLLVAFVARKPRLPRWTYAARDTSEQVERLGAIARSVMHVAEPLRSVYRKRLDELGLELAMVASVGLAAFGGLATQRHHERSRTADALAAQWAREQGGEGEVGAPERIMSDSLDPRSLLSQLRTAIGAHRAPFAVRPASGLVALAATGERTVYVVRGRPLSERTGRRVTLHEVLGHVLPRVRASGAHPIFALGTARGTDDQEGLALLFEQRAGLLDAPRRIELGRRHLAAAAMRSGADFVEVVHHLRALDAGVSLSEALHIATRAFRGSTGDFPGLGRERVYLPAFLRVVAHLRKNPPAEAWLASGQIAVTALPTVAQLGQLCPSGCRPAFGGSSVRQASDALAAREHRDRLTHVALPTGV